MKETEADGKMTEPSAAGGLANRYDERCRTYRIQGEEEPMPHLNDTTMQKK